MPESSPILPQTHREIQRFAFDRHRRSYRFARRFSKAAWPGPVALPLALAFIVGGIFVWQVTMLLSAESRVDQYDQIIDHANEILLLLVDMETGIRAYVITSDQKFLEPYENAQKPLDDDLKQLDVELKDTPVAATLLDEVIQPQSKK